MPSVLITGANRGLGLGLTTLYAADGWRIFACCRDPNTAKDLNALVATSGGKLTVHKLDVEDHASINAVALQLKGQPIDVLLNVAGYYGPKIVTEPGGLQEFGTSDYADWARIYKINVMGPMKLAEALIDNVAASGQKKIVNISSIVGSIGVIGNGMGGHMYGYRASKAALNAITRAMAEDMKPRGITVVPLHPGWVRTDMGGPAADIDAQTSVTGMKKVIDALTLADTGKFMVYDGTTLPW
jgi:NAD(P)-dependent dehydrogenase (short-subunit alcohol dehydrogenase family)